jgi:hypothetical protein
MKYLIALILGAGAFAGMALYLNRPSHSVAKEAEPQSKTANISESAQRPAERSPSPQPKPIHSISEGAAPSSGAPVPAARKVVLDANEVSQAVDLLVSPHVNHQQKRAAWKQLKENGGLDQAIGLLEQHTKGDGSCADCAAALGQAYLQKCGTTSDVRERGILAMQADKVFDSALNLDPSNWEARFNKAVALSYWPATMGKSDEVIGHFLTLIQQQETQPQQPQFAESYLWLGDQYEKVGRNDDAHSVWERGAALFPEHQQLKNRLIASP